MANVAPQMAIPTIETARKAQTMEGPARSKAASEPFHKLTSSGEVITHHRSFWGRECRVSARLETCTVVPSPEKGGRQAVVPEGF